MSPNNLQMVAVADMIPHPDNPRDDLGSPQELAELANDLAANGNTIRVRLFPIQDGPHAGKYLIIEGHRRRAAAHLGGVKELECWIDPTCDTLAKQIEAMLRENTHRVGITASNEAKAIQTLLDCEGMSVKKVAKAIHRSEGFIRKRSRLAGIPAAAHNLVDGGQLTLEQSEAFDEFKDNPAALKELLQCATDKYRTTHDWDRTVVNLRMRRDAPAHRGVSERLIKEHDLTTITENQAYSGHYAQIYDKTLSDEEHAAAGHAVRIMEGSGKLSWFKKSANYKEAKLPLTDEEKAAKRRLKDLEAGLEQDLAIWDEHLRRSITDAGGGLPLTKEEKRMRAGLANSILRHHGDFQRASELLLDKSYSYGAEATAELYAALDKLRPLQLSMLMVELHIKPDALHKPSTWDPTDYRWREHEGVPRWITVRRELFGYEPAVFEQEALDHFTAMAAAQELEKAGAAKGDELAAAVKSTTALATGGAVAEEYQEDDDD
jgi:ParB/RepB/Spo0J family partition protein